MHLKRWTTFGVIGLLVMALGAWNGMSVSQHTSHQSQDKQQVVEEVDVTAPEINAEEKKEEVVELENAEGSVIATATLSKADGGVHIDMEVSDLPPGTHGFHVHEKGVCEPPDFESAGGHYNPTNMKHGKLNPEGPHAGDFDNIEVDENGQAHVDFTTNQVTLEKGQETTLYTDEGTSLVIHADPDDYKSQPSGNAGERIACGVIGE